MNFASAFVRPGRPRLGASYHRLLTAQVCTQLSDGVMSVALVWLASSLTRDAVLLSLVALATMLPWLVMSLPAGVIADRVDRRVLVASMDIGRSIVLAVIGLVIALNSDALPTPQDLASGADSAPSNALLLLGLLYAGAALLGSAEVIRDNAAQTLMPAVVRADQLEKANGRMMGAEAVLNRFVGPPLAGVLLAVTIAVPFLTNAALLALAGVLAITLRGSFRPKPGVRPDRIAWRSEIGEGFRWLWRHRLLRSLAILLGAMNLLSATAFVLFVLFVQEVLGLYDGWQFGAVMTGVAIGATFGSVAADRIASKVPAGVVLIGSIVGTAAGQGAIGLMDSAVAVWVLCAVAGFSVALWNVVTVSLRQRIIPDALLGRVNSVYRFFGWGAMVFAPVFTGLIVTVADPVLGREWALRLPFLATGVLGLLLVAYAATRVTTATIAAAEQVASSDGAVATR